MPAIDPNDSTIRAEFMANAKRIHADLVRGDAAADRVKNLAAQLANYQADNRTLQAQASASQAAERTAVRAAEKAEQKAASARNENWIWRAALAAFLAYLSTR